MKNLALTILAILVVAATASQAQLPSLTPADSSFLTAFYTDTTGGRVPPDPNAPITDRQLREFWLRVVNGMSALDSRFMWVPSISRKDGKPTAIQSVLARMDSLDLAPITQRLTADSTRLTDDSTRIGNLELGMGELTEHLAGAVDLLDSTLSVQEDVARATLLRKRELREAALRKVLVNADELRQRTLDRKRRLQAMMP